MTPVRMFEKMETLFGCLVHFWPSPARSKPGFLDFREQRRERRINAVLEAVGQAPIDAEFRTRFWEEVSLGQIDEDAGGYVWRCWCAAMGVQNDFLDRYGRARPLRGLEPHQ